MFLLADDDGIRIDFCSWNNSRIHGIRTKVILINVYIFSLAIPPISLCFGLSTLIGSGLIFLTSVIYGMMVLGPK